MELSDSPLPWLRLIEATKNLTAPTLLPDFFAEPPISQTEVLAAFARVCAAHNGQLMSTLRVYQDGRREALEHALFASPPMAGDTLHSWQCRFAGNAPTAIVLNRAERWSAAIATLAADLNHALSGGDPAKLFMIEAVLFLGDYGYSPFGVHVDQGITRVVHIPLTSSVKSLYTWPPGVFEEATGGRAPSFQPDTLVALADRHRYQGGDLFFLPASLFHIGHSPEPTATLALVLTPRVAALPLGDAAGALDNVVGPDWYNSPTAASLTLADLLVLAREHRDLQWASGCGLSAPLEYLAEAAVDDPDQAYAIVPPFQILVRRSPGLAVYVRGASFALLPGVKERHVNDLCTLFAVLNTGESITLRLARHVAPGISIAALRTIFSLLVARHVLTAVT